jgi:hypothetical protein
MRNHENGDNSKDGNFSVRIIVAGTNVVDPSITRYCGAISGEKQGYSAFTTRQCYTGSFGGGNWGQSRDWPHQAGVLDAIQTSPPTMAPV